MSRPKDDLDRALEDISEHALQAIDRLMVDRPRGSLESYLEHIGDWFGQDFADIYEERMDAE